MTWTGSANEVMLAASVRREEGGGKGFTAKTRTVPGQDVGVRSTRASESEGRYTRAPATKHMGVRHHGHWPGTRRAAHPECPVELSVETLLRRLDEGIVFTSLRSAAYPRPIQDLIQEQDARSRSGSFIAGPCTTVTMEAMEAIGNNRRRIVGANGAVDEWAKCRLGSVRRPLAPLSLPRPVSG
ncbi:hypothetical protein E4U14_007046 [Claviceps sp. LM454 group G7]|nr:hypothetical protein E4U14_007046 [Claviceps sp. LM454 group G7]